MARALRFLLATAIALPLLVATGGRAIACSCAPQSPHQTIRQADAIVAGHVTEQVQRDPTTTNTTVAVDGVYRGSVPAEITLVASLGNSGGSSCAVLYPLGSEVDPLVLHAVGDGTYEVSVCSLLDAAAVHARLGDAAPPAPLASSVATPPPAATVPADRGISWPAVLGGLALAIVLIVWALRRAAREQRADRAAVVDDGPPPDGE
jgi:hypothetical protein